MARKAKAEQSAGRNKQTAPKQKEQNQNKKKTTAAKQTAANKKQPVKKQDSAKKKQTAVNKKQSAAVKTKQLSESLKVIPLGGLEQIGMNMTAIEYNGKIVVIDCGMAFADDTLLGIDLIIPDITYLKQNKSKVKAFFITHGHEDHIGAIPYILKEINVPIYGTKLTIALIRKKLEETKLLDSVKLKVVDYGQKFYVSDFKVEFIRTNHSISDAAAIAIRTPAGLIYHTGDFKVDYTPVYGDAMNLWRMAELGQKGVLAVFSDSTNAMRPGYTMSETTVGERFDALFAEHQKQRIIVATFASNVDRVQQVINTAYKYKRKVILEGRSMINVIETATELGYINMPKNTLISIDELGNYPDNRIVIITTGSQGESMAALSRMAAKNHKKINIRSNDVIIFSSNPIPGNEKAVANVMNELSAMGAKVVFEQTHVSGHACQEEIKLIYTLLKPKYVVPVHGEYRHRIANAQIAYNMGYDEDHVFLIDTGDILELNEKKGKVTGHVQSGGIYVDNSGVEDVGRSILDDRKDLSERGVLIVSVCLNTTEGFVVSGPEIFTRGWVYDGESEKLIEDVRKIIYNALVDYLSRNHYNRGKAKMIIADEVRKYLKNHNNKGPMILPFILEVE
ncbi:MAG: RNase J family beta-CASP ribonuclease [Lachnospiraceae bacterium]|nr:RNase J family beta-CASP ribonuclease [Lachnospiraceae bacterium]